MNAEERAAAWLEHQRRRWMRPDWERWMRPDASRWMRPDPYARTQTSTPAPAPNGDPDGAVSLSRDANLLALKATSEDVILRWLIADFRSHLRRREQELKYRPDQPRLPLGPGGGRWTTEAGTPTQVLPSGATDISAARKARGHHYVPQSLYRRLPLRADTRKVFDEAATGPLNAEPHGWSKAHQRYNGAVGEHLDRFLETNKIRPEQMTPDQAQSFVDQVKRSRDPGIRNYNLRIFMRELQFQLRRGPRRID
jgi:hypothetical protein